MVIRVIRVIRVDLVILRKREATKGNAKQGKIKRDNPRRLRPKPVTKHA